MINLNDMVMAYAVCALWSSTGDDGQPLDDVYTVDDIHPDTLESMREDCADFIALVEREGIDYPLDSEQFGHDFWLTRNGHGAGFWDRGLGEIGERLTDLCRPYGEVYLYVDDNGMVRSD